MKTRIPAALAAAVAALTLGACNSLSSEEKGMLGGAAVGGVVGSAATGGSTLGTVGGAVAGGYAGREITKDD